MTQKHHPSLRAIAIKRGEAISSSKHLTEIAAPRPLQTMVDGSQRRD